MIHTLQLKKYKEEDMLNQEIIDWHMARSNVYELLGNLLSEQPRGKNH